MKTIPLTNCQLLMAYVDDLDYDKAAKQHFGDYTFTNFPQA